MQDTRITAGMVAAELRKLADALDKKPDAITPKVHLFLTCSTKGEFLSAVAAMPRPLKKKIEGEGSSYPRYVVEHETPAIWINTRVPQSLTCTLVEPAKPAVYKCDPILSAIEEAGLEGAA